jgi:tripeptidyl-peptidase-1
MKYAAAVLFLPLVLPGPLGRRGYAIKEAHPAPRNWVKQQPALEDAVLKLQIALKQSNLQELERQLSLVSDPDSPLYGDHLSAEDVRSLVQPAQSSVEAVVDWLHEHDLHSIQFSPARDWIYVDAPVATANRMLDSVYHVYINHKLGYLATRLESYSLPTHLHAHIDSKSCCPSNTRLIPVGSHPADDLLQRHQAAWPQYRPFHRCSTCSAARPASACRFGCL